MPTMHLAMRVCFRGQVPTFAEIGRQFKRVRTTEILSDCVSTPQVQDHSLGQRAAHFASMSLANIAGQEQQGILDAKRGKIATYCRIQYPID